MSFKFQVNLRGIIELLSNHLYARPDVYVRELLQNAVDAITARGSGPGRIRIEVQEMADGAPTSLVFEDDGVGLTEAQVHRFLATIGESSKRESTDFLGQFGIGLLSCFVVSDEIIVVTRTASSPAVEWRGRVDGTYTVRLVDGPEPPVGTRVHLRAKPEAAALFAPAKVAALAKHYGGLLPHPIEVVWGDERTVVNGEPPPFRQSFADEASRKRAALAYGKTVFGTEFLDAIFLHADSGELEGVAFVLPTAMSAGARRTDRIYLKGMLLENGDGLLPSWAVFVRCLVDARGLRPNASREALYQDTALDDARAAIGTSLREWLTHLAKNDELAMHRLVSIHGRALKAMCLTDDDLFRSLVDWLPFETTLGEVSLGELRKMVPVVRYAPSVDLYRQLSHVAAAEGLAIVNAGYADSAEILERLPAIFPGQRVEEVRPEDVARAFEDLGLDDRASAAAFLRAADAILTSFRCTADIKSFAPDTVPALYMASELAAFRRSAKQTSAKTGGAWGALLDRIVETGDPSTGYAHLVFNVRNRLVRRLIENVGDRALLRHAIYALYTQALMLGHHPLDATELAAMNESLLGLVDLATTRKALAHE